MGRAATVPRTARGSTHESYRLRKAVRKIKSRTEYEAFIERAESHLRAAVRELTAPMLTCPYETRRLFRPQRGSLSDSLDGAFEVETWADINARVAPFTVVGVEAYGIDDRIGWVTYLVMGTHENSPDRPGIIGFTNGRVEPPIVVTPLAEPEPLIQLTDAPSDVHGGEQ